jgi:cell division protein FtsW (lipid II flippase)
LISSPSPTDRTQSRLLSLAALFLFVYVMALTLAPAVRARTWDVSFRWDHWLGLALWLGLFWILNRQSARWLPDRDPFLVPLAALLSGWGMLTIWRLYPSFGLRQSLWMAVSGVLFTAALRLPSELGFLRRYKYVWLTGGLLLTALTLIFGTNPAGGANPQLWLGCCGIYFQPSEPLKLLLVVYLAAYLAGKQELVAPGSGRLLPLLAPTLIMTGLAMLLLVVQRDLGTASIFLFLYAAIVYIATHERRLLLAVGAVLALAGGVGYALFDVVRVRVDAWLNPWLDPSGRSYQIVQSLIAVANGGIVGRGPGLGNPGFVPIPHSDFIYAALAEELGLAGTLALLVLLGLLASRGLRAAMKAPDAYRRYLAAGLTAFLVGQSILIIGGNIRLLPLTGVTLPLVSYGGTSLLTSYASILLLLHISNRVESSPAPLASARPYLDLGGFLLAGLAALALASGWWAIYRAPTLVARTDNPRRALADRFVQRGALLDRNLTPLASTSGPPGELSRQVLDPDLSPVIGYSSAVYGQSGLEASLDPILRGLQGYPSWVLWWNHLLYGQPPPGSDVRLTLDLGLQRPLDEALSGQRGAGVLINAASGEILAMASHPSFDANLLDQQWETLLKDPDTPLLNRATLGQYPTGALLGPLLLAQVSSRGTPLQPAPERQYQAQDTILDCAVTPAADTWESAVSAGCPGAAAALGRLLGKNDLLELFKAAGLYSPPAIQLPTDSLPAPNRLEDPGRAALGLDNLALSPLQAVLAMAALTNNGSRPFPSLVSAMRTDQADWVILSEPASPTQVLDPAAAVATANGLAQEGQNTWQALAVARGGPGQSVTWFVGGTLPGWTGSPLALAVVLEADDPALAAEIGQAVFNMALNPAP